MVSNDDFDGKATHLNCFYLHINFEQIYPKPAIVPTWHSDNLKNFGAIYYILMYFFSKICQKLEGNLHKNGRQETKQILKGH